MQEFNMKKLIGLSAASLVAVGLMFLTPSKSMANNFLRGRVISPNYSNYYMNGNGYNRLPGAYGANAATGYFNFQPYVLSNGAVVIPQSYYWSPITGYQNHGQVALPSFWGYVTVPY
jgi:hypothetical protein